MEEARHFKITILGSGGVGKTSLASRFTKDLFLDGEFNTEITQMPLHRKLVVDGIPVALEIHHYIPPEDWSTRETLLMRSDGYIVVYSLIAMSTFNDVPDLYESIIIRHTDREDMPLIIVGNKLDLCNDGDSENNIRVIHTEKGRHLASGGLFKFGFFEVSAKTNHNVNDLFIELVHRIIRDKKNHPPNNPSGTKKKKSSNCNTH